MPEEEDLKTQKRFTELEESLAELRYIFAKKTGSGSNDIKGSLMKSTNFLTGTRGWQITPEGDAEFQSVTIPGIIKFGGTGDDGALSITSGTTTIDLAGTRVLVRNYTSISITGTGTLAFSNPHANGTLVILRATGNVTITSTATRAIDLRSLGSTGGTGGAGVAGDGGQANMMNIHVNGNVSVGGTGSTGSSTSSTGGATAPAVLLSHAFYSTEEVNLITRTILVPVGIGGGGSGSTGVSGNGKSGGRGAGSLYIECGDSFNFTGTVDISGSVGVNGTDNGPSGGSGGGSGGMFLVIYNTLTANTGTVTRNGGAGGNGLLGVGANNGATGGGSGGSFHTYKGGNGGSGSNDGNNSPLGGAGGTDADGTVGQSGNSGSSNGVSGGGGGGASGISLIVKNQWFV